VSSSSNRKSSAQKRILYGHYGLKAPVCNANTPRNKGRKFFGCENFKEVKVVNFFGGLKVTVRARIQLQKKNNAQLMK
ncbi:hypothetical protein ERO13_D05G322350v2, partial [Gossypium hirsutum]